MIIRIDPCSTGTPAEQLVAQIAASIDAGEPAPGERLPTIRSLARDLGLAPGTVARAYSELEAGGWVHAQGRRGTRVAPLRELPRLEEMSAAAQRLAELAGEAGLGSAEAHQLLDIALARRDRDA